MTGVVLSGRTGSPAVPGPARRPTTSPTTTPSGGCRCAARGAIYERLTLEAFQSGLVVAHDPAQARAGFRAAFAGFDPEQVARFGDADRARLMADTGIVRNRLKVEAAITNARAVLGAARHRRSRRPLLVASPRCGTSDQQTRPSVPATSPESVALAKALKRAGFVFVGPTTMYAAMQACGAGRRPRRWGATGPAPGDARSRGPRGRGVPRAASGDGRAVVLFAVDDQVRSTRLDRPERRATST